MRLAASEVHTPAGYLDQEQHVQSLKLDRVDGEDIERDGALRLGVEERTP